MPSSTPSGGIRISVTTTSGRVVADGGEQRVEISADRDNLDLRVGLEQAAYSLAGEVVVVCEHNPNRHETS